MVKMTTQKKSSTNAPKVLKNAPVKVEAVTYYQQPKVMSKFHYLKQYANEGFNTKEQLITLLNNLEQERRTGANCATVEETVREVYAKIQYTALTPKLKVEICHLLAPVIPVWFGDEVKEFGWVDEFAFYAMKCLQQFYETKDPTYQRKVDTKLGDTEIPSRLCYYYYVRMCRRLWVAVHLQGCAKKPNRVFALDKPFQAMCRFIGESYATFGRDNEGNVDHVVSLNRENIFLLFENEDEVVSNVKGGGKLLRKCKPKRNTKKT